MFPCLAGVPMHGLIADLAIVAVVAAVTGMLAKRAGQPTILGYLLAGLIVGPYIPIPLFADPHRMGELAEVGVVLVMFAVGLEFRIQRLLQILPTSGLTAAVQIGTLSWAGFSVGQFIGWTTPASICLGATLAISSTMVVSAVLRDRPVDKDIRSHIFGVLVVQDVVAIVLMALVTALAAGESIGPGEIALLAGQLAAIVIVMLVAGLLVFPPLIRFALKQSDTEVLVVLVAGAAFGLAMAAASVGYSVALGAFIAGIAVAESGKGHEVERAIEPLRALFSAVFFVSIGMSVDPIVAWQSLPLALGLCAVVIGMQFTSVLTGTVLSGGTLRSGVHSGVALGQVGELSFILATIAIAGGIVPEELLPALVTVATITAFTTPLFLGRAQGLVEVLDHRLPDRFHQVLAAYQSFARGTRSRKDGPPIRRPVIAIVLDIVAIGVIVIAQRTLVHQVAEDAAKFVTIGAVVLAIPLVIGLARSGLRLVKSIHELAEIQSGNSATGRVVEAIAYAAVIFVAGLPAVAIARPLVDGVWGEVVLLLVAVVGLVVVVLRAGDMSGDYTSGVARFAVELAGHVASGDDEEHIVPVDAGPLAGLDYHLIPLDVGAAAAGQTLAQLDLRVRSGATVVAICRGDVTTTLPTGHEQLLPHDVLAISGSDEAIERARIVLLGQTNQPEPAPTAA